jgi:hypothetical protein
MYLCIQCTYLAAPVKVANTIQGSDFVERRLQGHPIIHTIFVVVVVVFEGVLGFAIAQVWVVVSMRYFFIFMITVHLLEGLGRDQAQLESKEVDIIFGYKVVCCRCMSFGNFITSKRER